jgi:hypothetical protein
LVSHELGDLILAHSPSGQAVLGMISYIDKSTIDIYHNLYHIIWLNNDKYEITNAQYTHTSIVIMKENLDNFLNNYDKK